MRSCQDVSAAGKRAGIKDGTRSGLWSVFAEAIDVLRPQYVVIENVRGLLSAAAHRTVEDDAGDYLEPDPAGVGNGAGRPVLRAAGAVLGDLADLGYDAQWATVAAADVGAPHRRERVFILAEAADPEGARRRVWDTAHVGQADREVNAFADDCGIAVGAKPEPGRGDAAFCGTCGHEQRLHCDWIGRCTKPCECPGFAAPHSSRNGWDEGRPESAGIVGGFDAAVSGDEPGRVELLPTPCVVDRLASGEMTLEEWDESRRSQKERGVGSFGPRGDSLGAAVLRVEEGVADQRPDYSSSRKDDGVALLPTPCAQQSGNTPENHLRKKPGRAVVTDLAILVENGLLETGGALLPTPAAQDGNGGGRYSSDGHQSTLPGEVRLLPTPVSRDGKDSHSSQRMAEKSKLTGIAHLLPTPNASDGSGGGQHPDKLAGHSRQLIDYVLSDSTAWGKYAPAIARWEQVTGQPAQPPTEPNKNGNPRLSAAFSEWLMGWPPGWVTDPAIGISRNDQLRCVGNGVVSLQAVAAIRYLLAVTA